jgi:hypothetical protein
MLAILLPGEDKNEMTDENGAPPDWRSAVLA